MIPVDSTNAPALPLMTGGGKIAIFEIDPKKLSQLGIKGRDRHFAVVFGEGPDSRAQVFSKLQMTNFAKKVLEACR